MSSTTPPSKASPDGLPPLREVIRTHQLSAKKQLGQNFILDLNLTRRIARIAGVEGATVIEVGPGPGGLTRAMLMEGAERIVAIERDRRCFPALGEIGERYPGKLDIIDDDALRVDFPALLPRAGPDRPEPTLIVANLPYGIATLLLTNWLSVEPWPPWYAGMTLMFQKEVAERIVAPPGTKAYGRLAVLAQWRTVPRIEMNLKPEAFTPPPKVASAIVSFAPLKAPRPDCEVEDLARVTAAAFGQRRKMLRQSLKSLTPMPELLLERASIAGDRRAETLAVEDFARLAAALSGDSPKAATN